MFRSWHPAFRILCGSLRIEVKTVKYMMQSFYKRFSCKIGFLVCCRMHVNSHCLKFHNTVLINLVGLLSSCFTVYPSSFSFFLPFCLLWCFFSSSLVIKLTYQKTDGYGGFGCFLDLLYVMGIFHCSELDCCVIVWLYC